MNLTYINVIFAGKVLRWELYLQDKEFELQEGRTSVRTGYLIELCINYILPPSTLATKKLVSLRPVLDLLQDVYERLTDIYNSLRGHVGLKLCKRRLKKISKQRVKVAVIDWLSDSKCIVEEIP
jgi:hypothetical protein